MDLRGEGVDGRPETLNELEEATVPSPGIGAPSSWEGGREAVCRLSRGGEGENGRAQRGIAWLKLPICEGWLCWLNGFTMTGMMGIGKKNKNSIMGGQY